MGRVLQIFQADDAGNVVREPFGHLRRVANK
jgi:hypothetical protein